MMYIENLGRCVLLNLLNLGCSLLLHLMYITKCMLLNLDILYDTIFLSYKSKIVERYTRLFLYIRYVISVTQTLFGLSVLKFLFIKLGLTFASMRL